MSYYEQTYQQMTQEIVEFTFSDAVFSCKKQEVVYTTQDMSQYGGYYEQQNWDNNDDDVSEWCEDLVGGDISEPVDMSQYGGYYEQQNWDNDDDDVSEWCEDLVGGDISEPVDMSSCGMYNYYNNYQYDGGQYAERYDQYQNQDQANQYQYQYDWYRYEIYEEDALDMSEVCKLAKKMGGELHTYYNTNNGNMYSYSGSGTSDTIEEFLEVSEANGFMRTSELSAGAKFGIVALVGLVIGAIVALVLRFKASTVDDKNVGLIDPDEAEQPKGEVA